MDRLTAIVLGSAAGGGVPQWNCRCRVCRLAWDHDARVKPRTQAGLAVSADGEHWVLLNASPDLRTQIQRTPELHPRNSSRGSPIAAVVLTGAEVDQIAGLLVLRERHAFSLFATPEILGIVDSNPIFLVLDRELARRIPVGPECWFELAGGLTAQLFIVPGKVPLYLEGTAAGAANVDTMGIELVAGDKRLVYAPGLAAANDTLLQRLARADVVFCDGTVFRDDELLDAGVGNKTGHRMGHVAIADENGSFALLAKLKGRKFLTHINNTNPILIDGSAERRQIEDAGIEIAEDGLQVVL